MKLKPADDAEISSSSRKKKSLIFKVKLLADSLNVLKDFQCELFLSFFSGSCTAAVR